MVTEDIGVSGVLPWKSCPRWCWVRALRGQGKLEASDYWCRILSSPLLELSWWQQNTERQTWRSVIVLRTYHIYIYDWSPAGLREWSKFSGEVGLNLSATGFLSVWRDIKSSMKPESSRYFTLWEGMQCNTTCTLTKLKIAWRHLKHIAAIMWVV